jgi:hypothetical protein
MFNGIFREEVVEAASGSDGNSRNGGELCPQFKGYHKGTPIFF